MKLSFVFPPWFTKFGDFQNAARLFKKEMGSPTMMGGPHVTYYREKALNESLDYPVIGGRETTVWLPCSQPEKSGY